LSRAPWGCVKPSLACSIISWLAVQVKRCPRISKETQKTSKLALTRIATFPILKV
jgi:hypothetical protein